MKKLGFGCMRLPMIGGMEGQVDREQFCAMIDAYLEAGFCYFDTARVYIGGQSETALRDCLVKRYPRDRFLLTDKLSGSQFQKAEDVRPLFESQLASCGVEYFDYYLMHSQTAAVYRKFTQLHAYETIGELKAEGRLKHFGISFHDRPEVLRQILTEHPEIEVVQIQLNYLDMDSPSIQSRAVYQVAREFGKQVLIMEPVKGGNLANLPADAAKVFADLHGGSPASYAVRFAAGFEGVMMVLSGMSTLEQMRDNIGYMKDFTPLNKTELAAVEQAKQLIQAGNTIPCTACRYCVAGCPKQIPIPDLFACLNTKRRYKDWGSDYYYTVATEGKGKPEDCIRCRRCERICPQHLNITDLLQEVKAGFA